MDDSPLKKKLPAELRNRVYELALRELPSVIISRECEPGLLRTCKQVREEAELLFYSLNSFKASCVINKPGALFDWLEKKGSKRLSIIKHLTINLDGLSYTPQGLVPEAEQERVNRRNADKQACVDFTAKLREVNFGSRAHAQVLSFCSEGADDAQGADCVLDPGNRRIRGEWHEIWLRHCLSCFMMLAVEFGVHVFEYKISKDVLETRSLIEQLAEVRRSQGERVDRVEEQAENGEVCL